MELNPRLPDDRAAAKQKQETAMSNAPPVRNPRRPRRSTAAPIRGSSTTTAAPCTATTIPISRAPLESATTRNFGSRKKLEKA